jgi:hypothetical protein
LPEKALLKAGIDPDSRTSERPRRC